MTIRRRDTIAGRPARRALGHVSVNIDDLRALMELLAKRDDVESDVIVEFDEGEFDDPDDMRELGNQNLRELRVKAGGVVIHLAENRAEVIGPPALAEFVDNAWARSRQTSRYPASWCFSQKYPYKSATSFFSLFAIGLGAYLYPQVTDPQKVIWFLLVVALLVLMCWLVYKSNKSAFFMASWAVIQPLSAHEVRDAARSKTTVPLWSLVVSIIGLIITSAFLVLNYIKPGP